MCRSKTWQFIRLSSSFETCMPGISLEKLIVHDITPPPLIFTYEKENEEKYWNKETNIYV